MFPSFCNIKTAFQKFLSDMIRFPHFQNVFESDLAC
jgi:hypothetical protein